MAEKRIVITIDKKGNIRSEVQGVAGPSCAGLSAWLTDRLGAVTDEQNTDEFYLPDDEQGITLDAGSGS